MGDLAAQQEPQRIEGEAMFIGTDAGIAPGTKAIALEQGTRAEQLMSRQISSHTTPCRVPGALLNMVGAAIDSV